MDRPAGPLAVVVALVANVRGHCQHEQRQWEAGEPYDEQKAYNAELEEP